MKLYYSPGACSLASHIALVESGEAYDKVKVDLKTHTTEDGADFYAISPRGYVPAIETDDIDLLTENPAVLAYLADHYGTAPAGAKRYKLLEWLGFIGSEIHGGFGPLFGGDEGDEAKQNVAKKFALAAELMGDDDWLLGDAPGVADNYLLVTTLWADKFGVELPQKLADFRARNMEREPVKKAMEEEGLG